MLERKWFFGYVIYILYFKYNLIKDSIINCAVTNHMKPHAKNQYILFIHQIGVVDEYKIINQKYQQTTL